MNIYNENGFLNIPVIANAGAWLNVIISARQRFGKTYGVLKYMLDNDITHILLRRTTKEAELISSSELLNPYRPLENYYRVGLFSNSKTTEICDYTLKEDGKAEKGKLRGLLLSLPQVANIRGFNGAAFTDVVFDEFIPEKGAYQRKTEGEALLNAYVTINGNRESAGLPPLRLWLLANANNLSSPILEALNLTNIIVNMQRKKQDQYIKDGVCVILPMGNVLADWRTDTALNRQIRKDSPFYQMSVDNTFSYDASPLIMNLPIKHMKPLFSYDGLLYAWENDKGIYMCHAPHNQNSYTNSKWDKAQLQSSYLWLKRYYYEGLVLFSDMYLLTIFRDIFDIDL